MQYEISSNKILRWPEEIAMLRAREIPRVLNVEVDLSEKCNLACNACDFPRHFDSSMTPITARQVSSRLMEWGTESVVLTGGGEPTLCSDFEEVVGIFARLFRMGMYTNGVSSNFVPVADMFDWVYISLDAPDVESWVSIKHGSPAMFDAALRNIKDASEYTTVGVGFLIHEDNYEQVQAMADTGLGAGATYVHFRPRWPSSVVPDSKKTEALEKVAEIPGVSVAWDKFFWNAHWQREYSICWASMFNRCVDASGGLWACPTTRWKRPLGDVWDPVNVQVPLPVTDQCRALCRGHGMNVILDYVMKRGPHDAFV